MSSPSPSPGTDQAGQDNNPWVQPRFVIAALVVALIIILGLVLAFTRSGDPQAQPAPVPSPAVTSSAGASTPPGGSVCGLEAGDQAIPATGPAGTTWELLGTIAVPSAPKIYGPGQSRDGVPACYAHSPSGALFAAANFTAAASDPDLRLAGVRRLTAAGPGQERAIREAEGSPDSTQNRIQIAGFTFLNYSAAAATVDLAFNASRPDGVAGLVHAPLTLNWEEGDWKIVIPSSGEVFPGIGAIPDLTGYTIWSGA